MPDLDIGMDPPPEPAAAAPAPMAIANVSSLQSMDDTNKFSKGGSNDVSEGPMDASKRGCTDPFCLLVFICSWGVYAAVTMMGVSDGNPEKLYKPRDFRGDYCGVQDNWNNGQELKKQEKLTYMMNITQTTDKIAKQLICSSVAEKALRNVWGSAGLAPNASKMQKYECACCKVPCGTCVGSLDVGNIDSLGAISGEIGGRMAELTNTMSGDVFSPSGANGDFFGNIWSQANIYFTPVCTTSCGAVAVDQNRNYTYTPFPDDHMSEAWRLLTLRSDTPKEVKDALVHSFTFKALPTTVCPYNARYCVPFPGVDFKEIAGGYCMFQLTAEAMAAVGDVAGKAFEGLGADKIADTILETWGSWTGDFVDTVDAFVVVAMAAFAIGLIFLVLLRFFVGCVVWVAILIVFLLFLCGGGLCYIRHSQCKDVGILESGHQTVVSVAMAAESGATNLAAGTEAPSEAMSGRGEDYRGVQTRTRTGRSCQAWSSNTPWQTSYKNTTHPNDGLERAYCRNPASVGATIWCYTTDKEKKWELCNSIGTVNSRCVSGYEVESEEMRKALEIIAYILVVIAVLWFFFVICMCKQILLAIAVNKVAAIFVMNTPSVLIVPMVQTLVGVIWCLAWASSAAFLISQVPDGHVPKEFYETYAQSYGTETEEGACTAAFVNGEVYKYSGNLLAANDPCSGNFGNITGITPRCWRCFPPRYVIDWRVAVSFFCFLWNNAFLIATGQFIVAVACGVWFFTPRDQKGQRRGLVRTGVWYCFRYHSGSLAMGAFIIAVVQFIRFLLMYLERQATAAKNRVAACVMRVVGWFLWCLEKCIKFLNKNAYIQIALLGKGFCPSAKAAFWLILRNAARFAWVGLLGGIINLIGIAFIVVATAVAGYFILKEMHPDITPVLPMGVYIATAYLVAKLYMNVFHLAVASILQCFLATEEMGGDNGFVPYQMMHMVKDMDGKVDGKGDA